MGNYFFTSGKYKTYLKSSFTNWDSSTIEKNSIDYKFKVDNIGNYYIFSTNANIIVDIDTLTAPNASISETVIAYGLTYDLYNNGLLIITGAMNATRHSTGSADRVLDNILRNALYVYYTGNSTHYQGLFEDFQKTKEIAYYEQLPRFTNTDAQNMFAACYNLLNIDLNNIDLYNVTDTRRMFDLCTSLITLDFSKCPLFMMIHVENAAEMFYRCRNLTSINFGTNFYTGNLTTAMYMFGECSSLRTLDISSWSSLYKLQFADGMFFNCSSLETLNFGSIAFFSSSSEAHSMDGMFKNCSSLTSISTSNFRIYDMYSADEAFKNCSSLTILDLSSWRPRQPYFGNEGFIDGCTALEQFTACAPRQTITLPKTMYDINGTAYTEIPFTSSSSSSQRITVYAESPVVEPPEIIITG